MNSLNSHTPVDPVRCQFPVVTLIAWICLLTGFGSCQLANMFLPAWLPRPTCRYPSNQLTQNVRNSFGLSMPSFTTDLDTPLPVTQKVTRSDTSDTKVSNNLLIGEFNQTKNINKKNIKISTLCVVKLIVLKNYFLRTLSKTMFQVTLLHNHIQLTSRQPKKQMAVKIKCEDNFSILEMEIQTKV